MSHAKRCSSPSRCPTLRSTWSRGSTLRCAVHPSRWQWSRPPASACPERSFRAERKKEKSHFLIATFLCSLLCYICASYSPLHEYQNNLKQTERRTHFWKLQKAGSPDTEGEHNRRVCPRVLIIQHLKGNFTFEWGTSVKNFESSLMEATRAFRTYLHGPDSVCGKGPTAPAPCIEDHPLRGPFIKLHGNRPVPASYVWHKRTRTVIVQTVPRNKSTFLTILRRNAESISLWRDCLSIFSKVEFWYYNYCHF